MCYANENNETAALADDSEAKGKGCVGLETVGGSLKS